MLLPSMTYKEMYDNLAADVEKVKIKEEYLLPRVVKEFKKERRFPAWRCYEYTIPTTGNKYIIFFYVDSRFAVENPKTDYFCIAYDDTGRNVIKWGARYFVPDGGELMLLREVQLYTSHFFDRYKERWIANEPRYKDISLKANDVACIYLSRNKEGTPIEMNEKINRHLEKYGEGARYGYRIRDGFCFTMTDMQLVKSEDGDKPIAQLVIYKTYMNESNMADVQLTAIDKSYDETWQKSEQTILEKLRSGNTTLTLEK